jgi:hypothetical protein
VTNPLSTLYLVWCLLYSPSPLLTDGHIRLTDYGLAKDFAAAAASSRDSCRGEGEGEEEPPPTTRSLVGTDEYLAPEAILCSRLLQPGQGQGQQGGPTPPVGPGGEGGGGGLTCAVRARVLALLFVMRRRLAPPRLRRQALPHLLLPLALALRLRLLPRAPLATAAASTGGRSVASRSR